MRIVNSANRNFVQGKCLPWCYLEYARQFSVPAMAMEWIQMQVYTWREDVAWNEYYLDLRDLPHVLQL